MNKRNSIIIIVLTIVIVLMVGFIIFFMNRKDNQDPIIQAPIPRITEETQPEIKSRFNGIKLENVKTICDARAYFLDLKNSDYETIKSINFEEVKQVMEKLPREKDKGPNSINDYYDFILSAEGYQKIIRITNSKKEFLNNHLEVQENTIGLAAAINRFYECEK
jgi:uncharacterized protein YneF (UPF0154 family)